MVLRCERGRQRNRSGAPRGPGNEVLVAGRGQGGAATRDGAPAGLAETTAGARVPRRGAQRDAVVHDAPLDGRLDGRVGLSGPAARAASQQVEGSDRAQLQAAPRPLPTSLRSSRGSPAVTSSNERRKMSRWRLAGIGQERGARVASFCARPGRRRQP
eukprot:5993247-Pyramimonas_sp.AAC.1